jgi:hypothetical protein
MFRFRFFLATCRAVSFASRNALDQSLSNDDQAAASTELINSGPNPLQKAVQIPQLHIAYAQVNDAWRWLAQHDSVRKIRILGHNRQVVVPRVVPDGTVWQVIAQIKNMKKIDTPPK